MTDDYRYSSEEINRLLVIGFAAPLIISTVAFMLFGVNICQFLFYFRVLARRDHLLTRAWVCTVFSLTMFETCYEVYFNWLFSIDFISNRTSRPSVTTGNIVAMYSVVIMLVQLFWLSCIKKLLFATPRLAWIIIVPIALALFASFFLCIAVAVISRLRPGRHGSWPTPEISILIRCALGLDLAVDLSVLIVIISQLTALKKSSGDLKITITKLSWILCLLTFASTLTIVGELYINLPQSGFGDGALPFTIYFAPLIPVIYTGSFLAVLNAREDLFSKKRKSQRRSDDSSSTGLIPGLKFTIDLPYNSPHSHTRQSSLSEPAMTFISTRRRSVERELEAT